MKEFSWMVTDNLSTGFTVWKNQTEKY